MLAIESLESRNMLCGGTITDLNALLFGWQDIDQPQDELRCILDNWGATPKQPAINGMAIERDVIESPPSGFTRSYKDLSVLSVRLAADYASNITHVTRLGKEGAQPDRHIYAPALGQEPTLAKWIETEYYKFANDRYSDRLRNGPPGEGEGWYEQFSSEETPVLQGVVSGALIGGDHGMSVVMTDVTFTESTDPNDPSVTMTAFATWTWFDRFDMAKPKWGELRETIANESSWLDKSLIAIGTGIESVAYYVGDVVFQLDYSYQLFWHENVSVKFNR